MNNLNFTTETPENYEQKCCCALVVDVSGSMEGERITELNKGLQEFHTEIQSNSKTANSLEVAIIEFSDTISTLVDPSLVANFNMPTLKVKGTTKLVDGVREGIKVVQARKGWYKQTGQPYYRPWIILITDGGPDSDQDVNALKLEILDGVNKKDFFFFALGVGGADMNFLDGISDPTMPPAPLKGAEFVKFFQWLSASMTTVTNSKDGDKVNLPSPSDWMKGFRV